MQIVLVKWPFKSTTIDMNEITFNFPVRFLLEKIFTFMIVQRQG